MSSFGKVKSSAKVLAFIGENAYIFFVKTDVNRPIPTLASKVKLLVEDKLAKLAGQVCMQLCMESASPAQGSQ